uniref:Uncharacterized protein n=1 Tax=Opuntia streptacantha TaxID=393608 RepID=A0A7C9E7I0_OPUST
MLSCDAVITCILIMVLNKIVCQWKLKWIHFLLQKITCFTFSATFQNPCIYLEDCLPPERSPPENYAFSKDKSPARCPSNITSRIRFHAIGHLDHLPVTCTCKHQSFCRG